MLSGQAVVSPAIHSRRKGSLLPLFLRSQNKVLTGTQLGRYVIGPELGRGVAGVSSNSMTGLSGSSPAITRRHVAGFRH
jgi:hypothetical protein